jgi:hypothetical protein
MIWRIRCEKICFGLFANARFALRQFVKGAEWGFYGPPVDDLLGISNLIHKLSEISARCVRLESGPEALNELMKNQFGSK